MTPLKSSVAGGANALNSALAASKSLRYMRRTPTIVRYDDDEAGLRRDSKGNENNNDGDSSSGASGSLNRGRTVAGSTGQNCEYLLNGISRPF